MLGFVAKRCERASFETDMEDEDEDEDEDD